MWPTGSPTRRLGPAAITVGTVLLLSTAACGNDLATTPGPDAALTASTAADDRSADSSATATIDGSQPPIGGETLQVETDTGDVEPSGPNSTVAESSAATAADEAPSTSGPTEVEPVSASSPPAWLGQRTLPTTPGGSVVPQTTPTELVDRRLVTTDILPAPTGDGFQSTVDPIPADVLGRSTWQDGCPVQPSELAYLTMSFWGFDERPHTGEMIVNATVADDVVSVFRALYDARYPIEEMRVTALSELDAEPTGDGNNTTAFVCRAVTGGSRFSQHAYGLAIDVNPFHNPYHKGDIVLPELSTSYLDRTERPGVIQPDGPVVRAFTDIGWFWGGDWTSLDDYHHFSWNNR